MRLAARGATLLVLALCLMACGNDEPSPLSPADASALAELMLDDPATSPLTDVDRALRQDRPVLAADLLRDGAMPAAERMVERTEQVRVTTGEGKALRDRLTRAYRKRFEALRQYEATLRRADPESLEALDSVRAQRESAQEVAAVHDRVIEVIEPPGRRRPGAR